MLQFSRLKKQHNIHEIKEKINIIKLTGTILCTKPDCLLHQELENVSTVVFVIFLVVTRSYLFLIHQQY